MQSTGCIAIGLNAGFTGQGVNSIAIGNNAGFTGQGNNSIAIGNNAGNTAQPSNTIIINALSNTNINGTTGSAFYVSPIRNVTGAALTILCYTGGEIVNNTSKTFVINHPIDDKKYLVHGCLEGPECAVYYRDESAINPLTKSVEINLPDYACHIADNFSVSLTQIADYHYPTFLRASRVINNKFTVYGDACNFWYTVIGTRELIEVEPYKNQVKLSGNGPYKYLSNL